jgi:nitrite reductase/ring-hydroxylating ferredoxin subunit
VYRQRIGVDHAQRPDRPGRFVPVMRDGELPEGGHRRADVEGQRLLLVRRGGRIQALGEVCAHLGGPLAEGVVDAEGVTCPWHGSRFSVEDGRVLDGPATAPVPVFEARVRDGMIEVRV